MRATLREFLFFFHFTQISEEQTFVSEDEHDVEYWLERSSIHLLTFSYKLGALKTMKKSVSQY